MNKLLFFNKEGYPYNFSYDSTSDKYVGKLLFDENLSPKLVVTLADVFPDSAHVDRMGLGGKS